MLSNKRQTGVWHNQGFSNLYSVFELIKQADFAHQFRLICTHTYPEFIGFAKSDRVEVEPIEIDDAAYLLYCLGFCAREGVRPFVPGRRMAYLADHRAAFAEMGVAMIVAAGTNTLRMLDSKSALYERLGTESIVPIPDYAVAHSLDEYDAAVESLRAKHDAICVKPDTGVYGLGFRILTDNGREIDRILNGEMLKIGRSLFRTLLVEAESFRTLMVMQYLEGRERSVDCLARNGILLRCVVRLKSTRVNGPQLIENNPEIVTMASQLTRVLGLHGLFNIQFKDSAGVPHLLEINPRMSGGLPYACQSGLNLPYWNLRLALEQCTPEEIPYPRTGVRVAQFTAGVVVEGARVNA